MKSSRILWIALIVLSMVPLSLASQVGAANQAFSVMRSGNGSIDLHFELPAWKLEEVSKDGIATQRVSVPGTPYLYIDDDETLPVFSTSIAIPYRGGASLSVLNTANNAQIIPRLDFEPLLEGERKGGEYGDRLYPANTVMMSEPMILRDFRIVSVNVYPFQLDSQTRQLHVSQSVDIRISFDNSPSINEMEAPSSYSSAFESIYKGLIVNYDSFRDRTVSYTSPKMLVIYGNYSDTIYLNKVNEYVAWKRQRGFIVNAVSTATSGTTNTAIKTYIQNQYNNASTRPDYIVLIGDSGTGSMQIPTYNSYIDYYYTWLAGGDNLGDVVIGRISVESSEQMINYMAKIVSLEQNINLDTAAWLNRMVLVADTAQSGISTIYTSEYIEDEASTVNPAYTYVEEYGSPSSTNINTAINTGVAFYNYRGYIGMSGWPSYISSLNNQYKLFHAVFITCATGNFNSGTATTESVVRQGSAAALGGSVTAIGMATSSTATPQNNCLNYGIYHSIFNLGVRDMGTAMMYGKLYLNAVYGISRPTEAYNFAAYCNLIGDPTAIVYVGIPSSFNVTAASSIPYGSANLPVTVKNAASQPVPGARVSLTNSSGTQVLGFADETGLALLSLSPTLSGDFTLTVSFDDFKAYSSTVSIAAAGGIVYNSSVIDDDSNGQSFGNGNGVINASETIELYVSLRNTSSVTITPMGDVMFSDPYLTFIGLDRVMYNPIAAGGTGLNTAPIVIEIAPDCPDQYQTDLYMRVSIGLATYDVYVPLTVRNGKLNLLSHSFVGATGNVINPGGQFPMTFTLQNSGPVDVSGLYGTLVSNDIFFEVTDSQGYFGNIDAGMTVTNSVNTFGVRARGAAIKGMIIPLTLQLSDGSGFEQSISYSITVGQPGLNDPLGQDSYGYFIFDDGDTAYPQRPTYQWIGIAPSEGGSGTALALTDPGHGSDEGDQVGAVSITTVNLPFSFKFYGVSYTRASISANGFIAFGQTVNSDWRNWRMPGAGGPSPMIAAFWDDLEFGTGSAVYTYYNAAQHYYVVQWHNLLSGYNGSSQETFQAILYDPIFYPTHTGDGQIKLQYKVIANIDTGASEDHFPHGNYATIGIEDHTATVGLEYTFNNAYPTQAKPLQNEMALFITTRPILPDYPYVALEDVLVVDTNSNGKLEPGENAGLNIVLINYGLQDAVNVSAVLTSSDPYVSITSGSASYGTIAAQASASPFSNYAITVLPSCPSGRIISFNIAITSGASSWNYQINLPVYTPLFEIDNQVIVDYQGNQNGILDPGETATVTVHLINNGEVASSAGTATLSCPTPGMTVNTGTAAFAAIAPGAWTTLSFNISASGSMSTGTLVQLIYNITAGNISHSESTNLEVGAPLVVTIGSGTSIQTYPLDRYYNYSAHEAIYLASEIGMAGSIKSIAFYKSSGSDVNSIDAVSIYMKHTTSSSMTTDNYSTAGYTLVYSGSFPNNAASGWMEVNLSPMFSFDGTSNLSVLTVKGYQAWISNYPNWTYSNASNRARQNRSDSAAPTNLAVSNNLPNVRFRIFPVLDVLMPPYNLIATATHQRVNLSWNAPLTGSPTSYKVYRNSSLLATSTTTSYVDLAVTNGTTYNYTVSAVYAQGESEATSTASATPNAVAPSNLSAVTGNLIVSLSWTAATGRSANETEGSSQRAISGYKVYRNGSALATVTGTSYDDTAVTNGTTYTYYVTTVYTSPAGESGPSNSVQAIPNTVAPTNLSAVPGNNSVVLSWTAATGRSDALGLGSGDRVISGYKVYRNGSAVATVSQTNHTDTGLTNGVTYTYYVTTVYTSPAGESGPSNTVQAIPTTVEYVVLGTGNLITTVNQNTPVNPVNNSVHGQLIYTTTEMNEMGVTGPVLITGLGFYVNSAPSQALPNFIVRMKHTTATNGAAWVSADDLVTTYSNASYMPTAGGWDMLMFTTPFEWNGVDNIMVDTAFSPVAVASASGTLQYTAITTGYRFAWSNSADQTNVFTGGTAVARRYNIRFALQNVPTGPEIGISPTSIAYGSVAVNSTSTQQFSVENTGETVLTGTITTPAGYSVALASRDGGLSASESYQRNVLALSVPAGQTLNYILSFSPTAVQSYNGNVVIASDAINDPTLNIAVSGAGIAANIAVDPASLNFGTVMVGNSVLRQFSIQNTGALALSGNIVTPAGYSVSAVGRSNTLASANGEEGQRNTLAISIPAGQSRNFQITFTPSAGGTYNGNAVISTNALNSPTFNLALSGSAYVNQAPTINLPESFSFNENAGLQVDFSPYVSDPNGDTMSLSASGNVNIGVVIDGLNVSFSAPANWYGSETLTFTVSDGLLQTNDTVQVNVIHVVNWLAAPVVTISGDASGLVLSWNAVTDATGYIVLRASTPEGPYTQIGSVSQTQFTDTAAPSQAFYKVKAVHTP